LNYYFIRTWGERAVRHFREKHMERRGRALEASSGSMLNP